MSEKYYPELTLILSLLLLWSCVVIIVALSYPLFIAH